MSPWLLSSTSGLCWCGQAISNRWHHWSALHPILMTHDWHELVCWQSTMAGETAQKVYRTSPCFSDIQKGHLQVFTDELRWTDKSPADMAKQINKLMHLKYELTWHTSMSQTVSGILRQEHKDRGTLGSYRNPPQEFRSYETCHVQLLHYEWKLAYCFMDQGSMWDGKVIGTDVPGNGQEVQWCRSGKSRLPEVRKCLDYLQLFAACIKENFRHCPDLIVLPGGHVWHRLYSHTDKRQAVMSLII